MKQEYPGNLPQVTDSQAIMIGERGYGCIFGHYFRDSRGIIADNSPVGKEVVKYAPRNMHL